MVSAARARVARTGRRKAVNCMFAELGVRNEFGERVCCGSSRNECSVQKRENVEYEGVADDDEDDGFFGDATPAVYIHTQVQAVLYLASLIS